MQGRFFSIRQTRPFPLPKELNLPNEIWEYLFSFLNINTKLQLRQVCKYFHTILNTEPQAIAVQYLNSISYHLSQKHLSNHDYYQIADLIRTSLTHEVSASYTRQYQLFFDKLTKHREKIIKQTNPWNTSRIRWFNTICMLIAFFAAGLIYISNSSLLACDDVNPAAIKICQQEADYYIRLNFFINCMLGAASGFGYKLFNQLIEACIQSQLRKQLLPLLSLSQPIPALEKFKAGNLIYHIMKHHTLSFPLVVFPMAFASSNNLHQDVTVCISASNKTLTFDDHCLTEVIKQKNSDSFNSAFVQGFMAAASLFSMLILLYMLLKMINHCLRHRSCLFSSTPTLRNTPRDQHVVEIIPENEGSALETTPNLNARFT